MDVLHLNIEYPSVRPSEGRLILNIEYPSVRSQMDV